MQPKEILFNGKKLAYGVAGSGKVVVLVHGFGEDGSIWQQQVQSLQNSFKVIVPHLPGSGTSHLQADMSMEVMAESVKAVIEAEGITECAMIGHSMGGYVTLAFAEKWERELRGFGLFHSTAFADSEEKKSTRQKGIDFIKQHGAAAFLKTTLPNLYSPATKETAPALLEQQLQATTYFRNEALIKYYEAMMARPDRTHVLKATALPVLFVLGRWDAAVPPEDGWKQCYLPQKSYIHMLDRSGHMGMIEEAEKSNQLLHEYLIQTL
ncbi:MAG: alpha/beta fold hydrolase [Chitinophagaceae bacterium]